MYALLNRYEVRVPKEELATVSDIRYSWKKLRRLAMDVSDTLTRMQVGFKRTLIREVKAFVWTRRTSAATGRRTARWSPGWTRWRRWTG